MYLDERQLHGYETMLVLTSIKKYILSICNICIYIYRQSISG